MNPPNFKDETGHRYGRLTVLERYLIPGKPTAYWKCRCDCGVETIVSGKALRNGTSRSCGCLREEVNREAMKALWARIKKGDVK